MKLMILSIICTIGLNTLGFAAHADAPFVCVTDQSASAGDNLADLIQPASFQCNNLKIADTTLQALSIGVEVGSIYMLCTGIGAPVTLTMQGVVAGLQTVKLIVGSLPCDDHEQQDKIEAAARKAVCDEMNKQGITCDL